MRSTLTPLICLALLAATALAQPERVAVKPSEPFVVQNPDGSYSGLAVELWQGVAEQIGVDYELVETDIPGLIDGVAAGDFAAGVGALTLTAEREERIDFTHPYYRAGLGIAVPYGGERSTLRTLLGIFTVGFATAVGALVLVLAAVGVVVWIVERRRNPEMFGGGALRGIGNGFWFSAVTMTTVGYGDKAPVSPLGRVVALVWMFASIIIISTFTGAIASALTADRLTGDVAGPADLPGARVGAVEGAASVGRLRDRGVRPRLFDSVDDGLRAVADGTIEAFVHDRPIMAWAIDQRHAGQARLLDVSFEPQPYALALPPGAERREAINRAVLEYTATPEWRAVVVEMLGE